MNDAEREFAQMLSSMEREVLDLKTAHQRPLGALDFFSKDTSFTVNLNNSYGSYMRNFYVRVKVADPIAKPPIVQTGWNTPANFYRVTFRNLEISSDYTTWTYHLQLFTGNVVPTAQMKVAVKSSQPITAIEWGYE